MLTGVTSSGLRQRSSTSPIAFSLESRIPVMWGRETGELTRHDRQLATVAAAVEHALAKAWGFDGADSDLQSLRVDRVCGGRPAARTYSETAIGEGRITPNFCNRETCPACGQAGSYAHDQRARRAVARYDEWADGTGAHWVIGLHQAERDATDPRLVGFEVSRQRLRALLRAALRWARKVEPASTGGLVRLHVAGKKSPGAWQPHVHVIAWGPGVGAFIPKGELRSARLSWRRRIAATWRAFGVSQAVEVTGVYVYRVNRQLSPDAVRASISYQVGPRARLLLSRPEVWPVVHAATLAATLDNFRLDRWWAVPVAQRITDRKVVRPPASGRGDVLSPEGLAWSRPIGGAWVPDRAVLEAMGERLVRERHGLIRILPDPIRLEAWILAGRPALAPPVEPARVDSWRPASDRAMPGSGRVDPRPIWGNVRPRRDKINYRG